MKAPLSCSLGFRPEGIPSRLLFIVDHRQTSDTINRCANRLLGPRHARRAALPTYSHGHEFHSCLLRLTHTWSP